MSETYDDNWNIFSGIFRTDVGKKIIDCIIRKKPTDIRLEDVKDLTREVLWDVSHYELLEHIRRIRCDYPNVHTIFVTMENIRIAIDDCRTVKRTRSIASKAAVRKSQSVVSESPSVKSHFTNTSLLKRSIVPVNSKYSIDPSLQKI